MRKTGICSDGGNVTFVYNVFETSVVQMWAFTLLGKTEMSAQHTETSLEFYRSDLYQHSSAKAGLLHVHYILRREMNYPAGLYIITTSDVQQAKYLLW